MCPFSWGSLTMDMEGQGDVGNCCDTSHSPDAGSGASLCWTHHPPRMQKGTPGHHLPCPSWDTVGWGLSGPLCVFQLTPSGREDWGYPSYILTTGTAEPTGWWDGDSSPPALCQHVWADAFFPKHPPINNPLVFLVDDPPADPGWWSSSACKLSAHSTMLTAWS